MTKNTKTHKGTKLATSVVLEDGVQFYYSRPVNSKKGGAYVSIVGFNPTTGERQKVRLIGTELSALKRTLAKA